MTLQENISLKPYNTFGIDVSARYFLQADSIADIQNLLDDKKKNPSMPPLLKGARGMSERERAGLLVLGRGSNILFTRNFDGVVVKNNIKGMELLKEDKEFYFVKAGAGEFWQHFVEFCIEKNYAGVENLSLIPGSVGAAPIQNIGAYGVEQEDIFYELEAIDLHENKIVTLNKADCGFGYRESIFKEQVRQGGLFRLEGRNPSFSGSQSGAKGKYMITSVTYKLFKKPNFNIAYGTIKQELEKMGVKELSIGVVSQVICKIRRSKLPDSEKTGNAGSFFKNPSVSAEKYELLKREFPNIIAHPSPILPLPHSPIQKEGSGETKKGRNGAMKLSAGWLIEHCGWKGKRFGNAGVYENQALVLVNYGGASGQEIFDLSEKILQSVKEKFGVVLEREVVVV